MIMTHFDKNKIKEEIERIRALSKMYDEISQSNLPDQEALETAQIRMKVAKEQILKSKLDISISIDGGVSKETEPDIIKSGCDILIYGSSIFK